MVCPYCAAATDVVNSRKQLRTNGVWRRRRCSGCGAVFTTLEGADLQAMLRVASSPNDLEPFSRDRLFISIYESVGHRSSALQDAANLTQQIINRLLHAPAQPGLVTRAHIIEVARAVLKTFDTVAAAHYGAYHPLTH